MTPQNGFEQIEKKLGLNKHSDRWLIAVTAWHAAIAFAREHPDAVDLHKNGYRRCAVGQDENSQFCGLATEAVAAEREKLAKFIIKNFLSTGHGDTTEDLLKELQWQLDEIRARGKTESDPK